MMWSLADPLPDGRLEARVPLLRARRSRWSGTRAGPTSRPTSKSGHNVTQGVDSLLRRTATALLDQGLVLDYPGRARQRAVGLRPGIHRGAARGVSSASRTARGGCRTATRSDDETGLTEPPKSTRLHSTGFARENRTSSMSSRAWTRRSTTDLAQRGGEALPVEQRRQEEQEHDLRRQLGVAQVGHEPDQDPDQHQQDRRGDRVAARERTAQDQGDTRAGRPSRVRARAHLGEAGPGPPRPQRDEARRPGAPARRGRRR